MTMNSFAKAVVPAIAVAAGVFMPVFADRTIDADYTLWISPATTSPSPR